MTLILSFGRFGGFYVTRNRVCLGRLAVTWYWFDFDRVIGPALDSWERKKK